MEKPKFEMKQKQSLSKYSEKKEKCCEEQKFVSNEKEEELSISMDDDAKEMGLSSGGKMKQKIYKDTRGVNFWDELKFGRTCSYCKFCNVFKNNWKKTT